MHVRIDLKIFNQIECIPENVDWFLDYLVRYLCLFLPYRIPLSFHLSIQDESVAADKSNSRDPAALAPSGFTLAASAYSQDQLYTNGGLNYSFRGYGTIGNSLQNNGTSQTNGG